MLQLQLAFCAEGSTDHRFFPILIQRTARRIIEQQSTMNIIIPPIISVGFEKSGLKRAEHILQAACEATGSHVLIVHADADEPAPGKAFLERFQPGYQLVQRSDEKLCKTLVPVIPVYMTEAWMLADANALREAIGIDIDIYQLGAPKRAKQVEAYANPKQVLKQIVEEAYAKKSRRHRSVEIDYLYELLPYEIRLERLNAVPAYRQFVHDLTDAFKTLNLLI